MALEGRLRLDISRKGQVYKRIEKKNTITPLLADAILDGDFQNIVDHNKIEPEKFYDGCILTDKFNNAELSILAGDSEIIACGGNDTYTGSNLKRGSYIVGDSSHFIDPTDGFTKVWRWDNSQGNGKINSVCLCPHELAIFDYVEGTKYPAYVDDTRTQDFNPPNKSLGYSYIDGYNDETTYLDSIAHLDIVDYTKGIGYYVRGSGVLSDGRISQILIDEYVVSTTRIKLLHRPDKIVRKKGETKTINLNVPLPRDTGFGDRWVTMSYTGDTIHIIAVENFTESNVAKTTLRDIAIPISDMTTYSEESHTYSDIYVYPFANYSGADSLVNFIKDGFVYIDNDASNEHYIYGMGKVGGSEGTPAMLRFNLTNNNVKSYDLSFAPPIRNGDAHGYNQTASILLPNGDFYKFYCWKYRYNSSLRGDSYSYYYHNDKVYAVAPMLTAHSGDRRFNSMNEGKNTIFDTGYLYGLYTELNLIHPYVSTVANLDEEVTKTYEFDMTLVYSIREV